MNAFTIVLLFLLAGLALLIFNHDTGETFGISNDDFGRFVYLAPIAALLSVGILMGRRGNLGQVVRQIAIWLLIILALVVAYLYRDDARHVGARIVAGLLPGTAVVVTASDGGSEVIIHKSANQHFQTNVTVNDTVVPMLIDTGASTVVLSYADARAIGLDMSALDFTVTVMTANGRALAAPVRLDHVAVGPIVRNQVRAMVTEDGKLGRSLLGMSFLSTLGSLQIERDKLRFRDY
ncbi:MAG: TIGR02281 family clan AA aspartic protease [Neorhizobium sp.]|nr:TIGR02281 family clan AA aspartic protease [Neorhizobium sp.]